MCQVACPTFLNHGNWIISPNMGCAAGPKDISRQVLMFPVGDLDRLVESLLDFIDSEGYFVRQFGEQKE